MSNGSQKCSYGHLFATATNVDGLVMSGRTNLVGQLAINSDNPVRKQM